MQGVLVMLGVLFGQPWGFWGLVSLASLAGFCLGILAALIGAKRLKTGENMGDILRLTGGTISRTATMITLLPMISYLAFGMLVGFAAGYAYRGDRENRERYTYTDVLVTARYDARTYEIHPARMTPQQIGLCADNDWQPWQKLRTLSFNIGKLTNGDVCLDAFEGGYEFYTKDGKRILYPQEIADGR